jgi:hypothetical protein
VLGPDDTIGFTPSGVIATRYPGECGVANPPFQSGDLYSLDVIGSKNGSPYDSLTVSVTSPVLTGRALALTVVPYQPDGGCALAEDPGISCYGGQSAASGTTTFSYGQGWDPSAIDTGAFDSATITIAAMPTQDGQPLTVRIQLHFVDGRVLDETFSAPLSTEFSGCPLG